MVTFFERSENMTMVKLAHSSAVAFPSGDILSVKSINPEIPFTPLPAVVNVGDWEMVLTRIFFSRP